MAAPNIMNTNQAMSLMREYARIIKARHLPPRDPALESLVGMPDRFPPSGSENKAMRWLGFMQGTLVAKGVYTLEEVKQHSKLKAVE